MRPHVLRNRLYFKIQDNFSPRVTLDSDTMKPKVLFFAPFKMHDIPRKYRLIIGGEIYKFSKWLADELKCNEYLETLISEESTATPKEVMRHIDKQIELLSKKTGHPVWTQLVVGIMQKINDYENQIFKPRKRK